MKTDTLEQIKLEQIKNGLESAAALCAYLRRHWREVGDLPSVNDTQHDIDAALIALATEIHIPVPPNAPVDNPAPIGDCRGCGVAVYTKEGFCSSCGER